MKYKTPMAKPCACRVWLSVLLFFFYGSRGFAGTWAYSLLTESRGVFPQLAGLLTGGYWARITVCRTSGRAGMPRLGVDLLVQAALPWRCSARPAVDETLPGGQSRRCGSARHRHRADLPCAHLRHKPARGHAHGRQYHRHGWPSPVGRVAHPQSGGPARRYSLEVILVVLTLIYLTLFGPVPAVDDGAYRRKFNRKPPMPTENLTNRLLGYPADARLLILNADDFGMCHAVNQAIMSALAAGVVRSATVMAPVPGPGTPCVSWPPTRNCPSASI